MPNQKSAGLDLAVMRPFLESLLKHMEGGVVTVDLNKRIMSFNKAAEWITGYCLAEVLGKPCKRIFKGSICDGDCPFEKVIKTGIPVHKKKDVTIKSKGGHRVFVSYSGFRLDDVHGTTRGMGLIIRDITELTNLREQLLQSEKLAVMGQLAAGVAHEINNPINGIITYVHLLLKRLKEGRVDHNAWEKDLKLVERETMRIGRLVRNLLNFSRKTEPDLSHVALDRLVEETLPILEDQFVLKGIQITKQYDEEIPKILGDYNQLQQVLLNLVVNAVQAVSRNGTIEIKLWTEGLKGSECFVHLDVTDNGVGIPKRDMDKIFDPFYTTKTGDKKGIGLGLSIVRQIIRAHHGRLSIDSEVGHGTTVSVRLPTP
jgi:two-component system sensor histidine kinase AtoS